MKLLVIGGSGLLGTFARQVALRRGHQVTGLSRRPPASTGPERWLAGDVTQLTERQLQETCAGQDAVVYALGLDDRQSHPRPSYPVFFEDHVTVCTKVARAARDAGVKKFVVYGSYFTHFDHTLPALELARHHPYVRSRCAQRDAVLALARPGFEPSVLELPYIIGSLPGAVPPWTFLFTMLQGPLALFFTRGGTAAVTARQVAQATLGAIEGQAPSGAYALGGVNWAWTEWARRFFVASGRPRALWSLPQWLFVLFGAVSGFFLALRGQERGLAIAPFARLQYADAFVDPKPAQQALHYGDDDVDAELAALVKTWLALQRAPRAR
jgi:nucleoside-diphosphate-sugar epimerase